MFMLYDFKRGENNETDYRCIHNLKLTLGKVSLILVFSCFHKPAVCSEPFLTVLPPLASLMLFDREKTCMCQVAPVFLNLPISTKIVTKTIMYHNCAGNRFQALYYVLYVHVSFDLHIYPLR